MDLRRLAWFCFITMSTIGFGDFAPQTHVGRGACFGFILIGLGLGAWFLATLWDAFEFYRFWGLQRLRAAGVVGRKYLVAQGITVYFPEPRALRWTRSSARPPPETAFAVGRPGRAGSTRSSSTATNHAPPPATVPLLSACAGGGACGPQVSKDGITPLAPAAVGAVSPPVTPTPQRAAAARMRRTASAAPFAAATSPSSAGRTATSCVDLKRPSQQSSSRRPPPHAPPGRRGNEAPSVMVTVTEDSIPGSPPAAGGGLGSRHGSSAVFTPPPHSPPRRVLGARGCSGLRGGATTESTRSLDDSDRRRIAPAAAIGSAGSMNETLPLGSARGRAAARVGSVPLVSDRRRQASAPGAQLGAGAAAHRAAASPASPPANPQRRPLLKV